MNLLTERVEAVTAATRAFGDLKLLLTDLEEYVRQERFYYMKAAIATDIDDSQFQAQSMSAPQADAVRADFLACNQRTADAEALLDHVLQEDPTNVSAQETLGFLEFRQGHLEEARKRYAQAV
jgi:Tfp pilus assembly protein PilF